MIPNQVPKAPVWIWRDLSISPVKIKKRWSLTASRPTSLQTPVTFDRGLKGSSLFTKIWVLIKFLCLLIFLRTCTFQCRHLCIGTEPPLVLLVSIHCLCVACHHCSCSDNTRTTRLPQGWVNTITYHLKRYHHLKAQQLLKASVLASAWPLSYPTIKEERWHLANEKEGLMEGRKGQRHLRGLLWRNKYVFLLVTHCLPWFFLHLSLLLHLCGGKGVALNAWTALRYLMKPD